MNLRDFLGQLEQDGKLIRITKEVSTEYEIANVMNTLGEQPVIFDNVKDSDYPVFGGITSSRDIIADGLGTTKEGLLLKLVGALRDPVEPAMVDKANAPCQEVVVHNPDLSRVPFLMHLEGDGGKYATATCSIIKDPETGRNMSYHRLMFSGGNKFMARLIPKRQTRTTYDKIEGNLEMAVCIGNSVPVMVAASLGPAPGNDELAIANALGKTDLVKCVTKDLEVPAGSEIVLEGRLTRDVDKEGPFVDLTETRDFERQEPIFIVDCITHRKDAMYQALLAGRKEHKLLMGMPKEPTIYDEVSKVCECKNVVVTMGGGSWLHGIVQIVKKGPDDGKKAIEAAFLGHKSMKHVIVVEDDVDIYDPIALEWALATRFQADKDAMIMPDQPGSSLDPSGDHSGKKTMITRVGLDATIPAGIDPAKYEKVKYKDVNIDDYRG
ncbi:MAG: UbiD family decarboxylase [Thermoplasmata archaeon]|nr:UbiD family decarboxylase [Thermoplasmata archaeon]